MQYPLSADIIAQVSQLIAQRDNEALKLLLLDFHFADIAELINELNPEDGTYVMKLLDIEITSEVFTEIDPDLREQILKNFTPSEIADELEEMDTDDAVDIIAELDDEIQKQVIHEMEDKSHAADIVELLRYDEDTAGGLMAKELVKVKENWTVSGCVREMRKQAEHVTRVHSIYVVDDEGKLKGRLSLKDLLTAPSRAYIRDIYIPKVDYVTVHTEGDEIARIMQKYDLEAIPVVDDYHVLVGRVTIDDIVDYIREEADKDYQLAAGITGDVESSDTVFKQTRARLPWLLIGMLGGLGAATIISNFEMILTSYPKLLIFVPLIQATAGNVGVQSSAIIVQGLANGTLKGHLMARIFKETSVALINGISLAVIVLLVSHFVFYTSYLESLSIGVALISVIVIAAIVGNLIPLILNNRGIDPALATGPFITTSNDIFGIFTYFLIAKTILGF
ncbi:MAG: magnesium transporter [Bacteroidetes bacterium]|nr:magnesium transporter [Bacteroidota bacterium]